MDCTCLFVFLNKVGRWKRYREVKERVEVIIPPLSYWEVKKMLKTGKIENGGLGEQSNLIKE